MLPEKIIILCVGRSCLCAATYPWVKSVFNNRARACCVLFGHWLHRYFRIIYFAFAVGRFCRVGRRDTGRDTVAPRILLLFINDRGLYVTRVFCSDYDDILLSLETVHRRAKFRLFCFFKPAVVSRTAVELS